MVEDDCFWRDDVINVWYESNKHIPPDMQLCHMGNGCDNIPCIEAQIDRCSNYNKYYKRSLRDNDGYQCGTICYMISPMGARLLSEDAEKCGMDNAVDHFITTRSHKMKHYILSNPLCYSPLNYKSDIR